MIAVAMVATFAAIFLIYLAIVGSSERMAIQERIKAVAGGMDVPPDTADLHMKPLWERLLQPGLAKIANIVRKVTPSGIGENTHAKLARAGFPGRIQVNEFLGIQGISAVLLGILGMMIIPSLNLPSALAISLMLLSPPVGFLIPDAIIQHIIQDRQTRIRKSLPDTIDLLIVSVEAGIGFDGALSRVVEKTKGPLAEEFERVLKEMRFGSTRSKALRDMAKRTGVSELSTFVAAIYQADQLGVSISKVLHVQGSEMRKARSRRAREAGAKLPVKMLIPLILFIFPATMVVIAGPSILMIMRMFTLWNVK